MKYLWAPWRMAFIEDAMKSKTPKTNCVLCTLSSISNLREGLVLQKRENVYIVLNKYPYNTGHLMVVPHQHTSEMKDFSTQTALDLQTALRDSIEVLKLSYKPDGFNLGMNLGSAGGAGIPDHLHYHIVPRWTGDTNFVPVLGDTKVLPESLESTYDRLLAFFIKM